MAKLNTTGLQSTKELVIFIQEALFSLYNKQEAGAIARRLLEDYYNLSRTDYLLDKPLPDIDHATLQDNISLLQQGTPVQHITGFAQFLDYRIHVSQHVLIPRPETEELALMAINAGMKNKVHQIIDIGTGSGCLAIALKAAFPSADVIGLDVSEEALTVARQNATRYGLDIDFQKFDMLTDDPQTLPQADLIVSNPPYVTAAEKKHMHQNVTGHEPATALYVPDEDPLVFYKAIARFCEHLLLPEGHCFLEINEQFGKETAQLFTPHGDAHTHKDINGKERFVSVFNPLSHHKKS